MNEIIIRKVRKDDLMQVSEISVNAWKTAYRGIISDDYLASLNVEQKYKKLLEEYASGEFIVAEVNDKIVGFCRYSFNDFHMSDILDVDCELCALYVRTENKGLGIGKSLINYVKNEFKNAGCKKMVLWCLKDNYSARMFYEKMGGIFHSEKIIIKGEKEYKEVSYLYDLISF